MPVLCPGVRYGVTEAGAPMTRFLAGLPAPGLQGVEGCPGEPILHLKQRIC